MTVDETLDRLDGVRRSGKGWMALCPAHDDRNPSLSITEGDDGKVLLYCHAGCEFGEILASIRDRSEHEVGSPKPTPSTSNHTSMSEEPPVTVRALAEYKRLPEGFLRGLGVRDAFDGNGVVIEYRDERGQKIVEKGRLTLSSKGSRWPTSAALRPYGLDSLATMQARGELMLVEGESDHWTAAYYNQHVLGMPGANSANCLEASHVRGVERIFIIEEPDAGGRAFVCGLRRRLDELGWHGDARVIRLPVKDLSELHLTDPDHFLEILEGAKKAASSRRSRPDRLAGAGAASHVEPSGIPCRGAASASARLCSGCRPGDADSRRSGRDAPSLSHRDGVPEACRGGDLDRLA